ncbi:MAG: hypothetical protein ACRDDZ_05780 [Marinifilaceae bacterium]
MHKLLLFFSDKQTQGAVVSVSSAGAGWLTDFMPLVKDLNVYLQTLAFTISIAVGLITIISKLRSKKL